MDTIVIVLVALNLLTLLAVLGVWLRTGGLAERVTRLEAKQEHALTHAEVRAIFERLSSIEGQIQTTKQLMQTVQNHLLETP